MAIRQAIQKAHRKAVRQANKKREALAGDPPPEAAATSNGDRQK